MTISIRMVVLSDLVRHVIGESAWLCNGLNEANRASADTDGERVVKVPVTGIIYALPDKLRIEPAALLR